MNFDAEITVRFRLWVCFYEILRLLKTLNNFQYEDVINEKAEVCTI